MRARPSRDITVGAVTPISIRKAVAGDPDSLPVTFAVLRYASGGGTIEVSDNPSFTFGQGQKVDADTDFVDASQSLNRFALSSAGNVTLRVTDYEA